MKVKLYQISPDKEQHNLLFMNYDFCQKRGIRESAYEVVYEGDVEASNLDEIYIIFNRMTPKGYCGHSMSVSDIVWAEGLGTYFCDSVGFKPIKFDGTKCEWRKNNE